MSNLRIIIADSKSSPAWQAWRQVLSLILGKLVSESDILNIEDCLTERKNRKTTIGIVFVFGDDPEEFWRWFVKLERAGCDYFLRVPWCKEVKQNPWDDLGVRWRRALTRVCWTVSHDAVSVAEKIETLISSTTSGLCPDRMLIRSLADAKELARDGVLPEFSHGGVLDITNLMLGPARMICGAYGESEEQDRVVADSWKSWSVATANERKDLTSRVDGCDFRNLSGGNNNLALELHASWKVVGPWLSPDKPEIKSKDSDEFAELEHLMILLTEIRQISNSKPGSSKLLPATESSCAPLNVGVGKRIYRMLVIDDHSHSWRSALALACQGASTKLNVSIAIEFSRDGNTIVGRDYIVQESICGYDMVLLDVYLPDGRKGTDILAELRDQVNWLPIILWTSSFSAELAGSPSMHNGYLFKKSTSIKQIEDTFTTWLPIGSSRRNYSLPNRFFNYTIKSVELRSLAVDCHEWCLKQLDSFHALDNVFFRHFTDHGGRHIVKLWDILDQALRTFLNDEKEMVLSRDPAERELELAGLYLAVIFHELGMFPMAQNGTVEEFSKTGGDYLGDVRALHSVRGMVLLADGRSVDAAGEEVPDGSQTFFGRGRFWNDRAGRSLGRKIREDVPLLVERVAVIVGYHARLFRSLQTEVFLNWPHAGGHLKERLAKCSSSVASLARGHDVYRVTFEYLGNCFSGATRERLRRQCALFRFVDALDITASRNPAEFLVQSGRMPSVQYRENLKRELCESVGLNDGLVNIRMKVSPPSFQAIKDIEHILRVAKNFGICGDVPILSTLNVAKPWDPPDGKPFWSAKDIGNNSVEILQAPLNEWLKQVWKLLVDGKGDAAILDAPELSGVAWIKRRPNDIRLTLEGARVVASVTALTVAGELLEEYSAVIDAELEKAIRIKDGFHWGEKKIDEILEDLPTLDAFVDMPISDASTANPQSPIGGTGTHEIKLLFTDNSPAEVVLEAFDSFRVVGPYRIEFIKDEEIRDIYFDTIERTLRDKECSLRARRRSSNDCELQLKFPEDREFGKYTVLACKHEWDESVEKVVKSDVCHKLNDAWNEICCAAEFERLGSITTNRKIIGVWKGDEKVATICIDRFLVSRHRAEGSKVCAEIEIKGDNPHEVRFLGETLSNWFGLIKVNSSKLDRHLPGDPIDSPTGSRGMIWLDMDPGVDDALALLYLLAGDRRPVIAGISVTGGNVDVSQCARNAARICYWAKWEGLIEQIPTIACGTDLANVREGASNVHGEDGMGDWNGWEEIDKEIGMGSGHKAVDVLNRALSNDPGIITIVATGPCSNLAQLIEKHPSSLAKAKEIIIMGGAFFDAGNRGPRSEFNIHSDSAAAREVLRYCRGEHPEMLGIITPLTFVGLDVTHRVMLERKVLGKMNAPIAKLAAAISGKYMNFYRDQALGIDGCPLHDPLAVAIALRPELVVREPYHVEIVSTPDVPDTDGITVADYRPCERFKKHELAVTQVCVAVDSRAFLDDFYHRINRPSKRTSV